MISVQRKCAGVLLMVIILMVAFDHYDKYMTDEDMNPRTQRLQGIRQKGTQSRIHRGRGLGEKNRKSCKRGRSRRTGNTAAGLTPAQLSVKCNILTNFRL